MRKLCNWFNQYRDGMLTAEQKEPFESHLATCMECRARLYLLDNLVHTIRDQYFPYPAGEPATIADRAYEKKGCWDVLLLSWVRPMPAWAGLAALLVLLAFLWAAPSGGPLSDYESLQIEASQAKGEIADLSDDELENWLEKGGSIQ